MLFNGLRALVESIEAPTGKLQISHSSVRFRPAPLRVSAELEVSYERVVEEGEVLGNKVE
jgi:hypothetical protein